MENGKTFETQTEKGRAELREVIRAAVIRAGEKVNAASVWRRIYGSDPAAFQANILRPNRSKNNEF